MMEIIRWVNCCVTLHNMLGHLGDAWDGLKDSILDDPGHAEEGRTEDTGKEQRDLIQSRCLEHNYLQGVLPI
jgi:hypothetical protein